jgi:hypothetical protein
VLPTERSVAKLLITLCAWVSIMVTASDAALISGRSCAARYPSSIDCVIPPAQNPIVFTDFTRARSSTVSIASMQAAMYVSSDHDRCSGRGFRHDSRNTCCPLATACSTRLRPGARSRK